MYIFDANVFINYLRKEEKTLDKVENLMKQLFYGEIKVLVPDLCFYEVIYNLKKKEVINNEYIETLDEILSLENLIIYKSDAKEYKSILSISVKYNTSTYDGAYLYLHDLFPEQKIITLDKRFFHTINNTKNIIYI
jgi:predicted nucleic acid-binding protein